MEVMERPLKREITLNPQRMELAEQKRQDWVVDAEQGTTIEDLQKGIYWAHMAVRLSLYDHIEVREETGAWIADLVVVETGRNYAQVVVKHVLTLGREVSKKEASAEFRIEFKGPHLKHVVIRNADSAVIQDGLPKKEDAVQWLKNHEAVIAR